MHLFRLLVLALTTQYFCYSSQLKRAKKAAQKASAGETAAKDSEAGFKCVVCQAGFPSKTRLFNHIKDQGHAAPVAQMKANSGKGKKK
jgi:DnaJ family protein A protein 5